MRKYEHTSVSIVNHRAPVSSARQGTSRLRERGHPARNGGSGKDHRGGFRCCTSVMSVKRIIGVVSRVIFLGIFSRSFLTVCTSQPSMTVRLGAQICARRASMTANILCRLGYTILGPVENIQPSCQIVGTYRCVALFQFVSGQSPGSSSERTLRRTTLQIALWVPQVFWSEPRTRVRKN